MLTLFIQPDPSYNIVLHGEYQWSIVLLSLAIIWFAAYVAISTNQRIKSNTFFHRHIWLLFSSIAMGIGIWAMHFIGMSAYHLPIAMGYNHVLTVLSILPAIGAAFIAFYLVNQPRRSLVANIVAAIIMGLGIVTMHYVGMYSMVMDAKIVYRIDLFILSVFIAIAVSFLALYAISSLQDESKLPFYKIMISFVLAAVSSMHYVAMLGTDFYIPTNYLIRNSEVHHMNILLLISGVSATVVILLLVLIASLFLDRYIEKRIRFFDAQTRLPNGRYYEKEIEKNIGNKVIAVWQINSLKKITNEYGYADGDELVNSIVRTLQSVRLPYTKLYRMKGNQFAFLMDRTDQLALLERTMHKIAEKWQDPIQLRGKSIQLEASCAIASIENSRNKKSLYNDAVAVLEHSATPFQREVVLYDPLIHRFSFEQKILGDLDRAMEQDELYLEYQPKICSDSDQIVGFEALVRWQHPEYGRLSPGVFIPIIEKSERIFDLTNWVMEQVFKQLKEWKATGYVSWTVAINIPGDYVSSPKLLSTLNQMSKRYRIEPHYVELELTETSFVESIETANQSIAKFRELGYAVALDDFGTGLSSLSYLKQMAISTLKIDKSFVDYVPESSKDANILKAIIALGQSLDLKVVIEGIETAEQVNYLKQVASSLYFQGYYFAKPMKEGEVLKWIDRHDRK